MAANNQIGRQPASGSFSFCMMSIAHLSTLEIDISYSTLQMQESYKVVEFHLEIHYVLLGLFSIQASLFLPPWSQILKVTRSECQQEFQPTEVQITTLAMSCKITYIPRDEWL